MDTDNDSKPIAPKRKTRRAKYNSSESDPPFEENPDKHKENKDNDQRGNIHPAKENVTKQDSGDLDKAVTKYEQDSATPLSNMKDKLSCMYNGDESAHSKRRSEDDNLVNIKSCTINKTVLSISDSLTLTEKKSTIATEEDCVEKTPPKDTHFDNMCDLPDGQSHSIDLEHTQEDEDGNKSCDGGNNTDDYPENLNPFADSTSEPDDGSETIDAAEFEDLTSNTEHGPARTTAKARPSLYPWRPFAGVTNQYKSHMIPDRQTFKTRASLYPWRPFGVQEYPDELNPFCENNVNDDHDDRHLNKALEEDSKHPNIQQKFAPQIPSKEKYQTLAQEIRQGQENVPSKTEDDYVEVLKPKKIGRGKKFLKTVRKKVRKFWDRVRRR